MTTATTRLIGATALAASLAALAPAWAQMHTHGSGQLAMPNGQPAMPHGHMGHMGQMGQMGPAGQAGQAGMPAMTDAEVRKIDMEAGKITLRHGEIKHLQMPPMTMVFTVQDKALLERVKVGDKVRFQVLMRQGQMVLTDITPAP